MSSLSKRLGDLADQLLERLLLCEKSPAFASLKKSYVNGWGNLWAVDYYVIDGFCDELDGGGRFYLTTPEAEQVVERWPIDVGFVARHDDHWQFTRIATPQLSALRGLTTITPAKCLVLSHAWLRDDDRAAPAENTILGFLGGKWKSIESNVVRQSTSNMNGDTIMQMRRLPPQSEIDATISIGFAIPLTERYDWHVAFGFADHGPRVIFPTNPSGCLALFRSRNLGSGEKRRAALRHWVTNHYRQIGADNTNLSYIRDHLRGNTRFIWNGLDCELLVSEFDLEKNEFFRLQSGQWRATRQHNRPRLRQ